MKIKTLTAVCLAVATFGASAEWVVVSDTTTATTYADPDAITLSGQSVKLWTLTDYKTSQRGDMSAKGQHEYDCEGQRWRLLYVSFHPDSMGRGEASFTSNKVQAWMPMPPGSDAEILWKSACLKY